MWKSKRKGKGPRPSELSRRASQAAEAEAGKGVPARAKNSWEVYNSVQADWYSETMKKMIYAENALLQALALEEKAAATGECEACKPIPNNKTYWHTALNHTNPPIALSPSQEVSMRWVEDLIQKYQLGYLSLNEARSKLAFDS